MAANARNSTSERLRDAAIRLFDRKGFAATGIRELASEADVSISALYHHMDTKNSLLHDLMLEGMTTLLTPARALLESPGSPVVDLLGLVKIHVAFHCERSALAKVTDVELRSLSAEDRQSIIKLRDEYQKLWFDTIVRGCAEHVFAIKEPRLATFALLEMCTGTYHWYSPDGHYSVEQIAHYYGALALNMLGHGAASSGAGVAST